MRTTRPLTKFRQTRQDESRTATTSSGAASKAGSVSVSGQTRVAVVAALAFAETALGLCEKHNLLFIFQRSTKPAPDPATDKPNDQQ